MSNKDYNARAIALDMLQSVLRRGQAFDEVMEQHVKLPELDKRDRAFVYMLVATVLRRLGQIDEIIKASLDKPQMLKGLVEDLLRLGVCQILFLRTPAHAAVDTIVGLAAQENITKPYKNMINAVLRRIVREGTAQLEKQDVARLNVPDWLWLNWRKTYGTALTRKIAEANMNEAALDITVKDSVSEWSEALEAKILPNKSLRREESSALTELPGFAQGAWWVQDAAASLPVKLFGDIRGEVVVDLCAAPGGKTAQLAAAGAHVIAVDRSAKRLNRLKENLVRLKLTAEIVRSDALKFQPKQKVRYILLDAPCTATGTIRRHPDVQRLKTPEDMARLVELQQKLLRHAGTVLAAGGVLIYAVCSLQADEAEAQIDDLLQAGLDLSRDPIRQDEVDGISGFINPRGELRCLPCHWAEYGGIDGFFVARLKRN